MIENLRYFINNSKLVVKWNWYNVDSDVEATCHVKKRVSDETIYTQTINLTEYENNKGGCVFTFPSVPAYIEVRDNQSVDEDSNPIIAKRIVWETPAYRINIREENSSVEVRAGLFGHATVHKKGFVVEYPENMTDEERKNNADGWMIAGSLDESPFRPFFFPKPNDRITRIPPFVVSEQQARKRSVFKIVDEVERTRYKGMFAIEGEKNLGTVQADAVQEKISFGTIGKPETDGYYETICPYCFNKLKYNEPVFRAKIGQTDAIGYRSEPDEVYTNWCNDVGLNTGRGDMGKVLSWGTPDISGMIFMDNPSETVPYRGEGLPRKIVAAVIDARGNRSDQKLCPYCHNNIPVSICRFPQVLISMMGDTGSGKTVYMASMLHQLETGALVPGYKFRCGACTNSSINNIRRVYETKLAGHSVDSDESTDQPAAFGGVSASPFGDSSSFADISSGFSSFPSDSGSQSGSDDMFDVSAWDSLDEDEPMAQPVAQDDFDMDMSYIEDDNPVVEGPKTEKLPQATAREYMEPYIYELVGEDPDTGAKTGVILSFFDFPGEALRRSDDIAMTSHDRYLQKMIELSNGLIFLFDPSTLDKVKKLNADQREEFTVMTLTGGTSKWGSTLKHTPAETLKDFRNAYVGGAITRMDKPVAFALSKSDAIRDYLVKDRIVSTGNTDFSFLEEGVYSLDNSRSGIQKSHMLNASQSILNFIDDSQLMDESRLILEREEDGIWICVSSTGISPDAEGTLYQRHGVPVNVIQPVEWILYRLGARQG